MSARILIVDDHPLFREGIANILRDSWHVCGEAGDGQQAVDMVRELKPDLVLLDLSMPIMGGTEAARQIRRLSPSTKIVFLSMHDSDTVVELTRLAGADASVSKSCVTSDLRKAIAAVLKTARDEQAPPEQNRLQNRRFNLLDPT